MSLSIAASLRLFLLCLGIVSNLERSIGNGRNHREFCRVSTVPTHSLLGVGTCAWSGTWHGFCMSELHVNTTLTAVPRNTHVDKESCFRLAQLVDKPMATIACGCKKRVMCWYILSPRGSSSSRTPVNNDLSNGDLPLGLRQGAHPHADKMSTLNSRRRTDYVS